MRVQQAIDCPFCNPGNETTSAIDTVIQLKLPLGD